jgi:hypothetical protein
MMCRILPSLLTALAVVVLPQIAAAEPAEQGPQLPGPGKWLGRNDDGSQVARPPVWLRLDPKQLFKRLDANQDGQVTPDEIPPGAPDRLRQLLKRADVNQDKQVSPDELAEAIRKLREAAAENPPEASRGRRPGPPDAMTGPTRPRGPGYFGPWARGSRRGLADAVTGPTRPRGPGYFAWRSWGVPPGLAGVGPGPRRPPGPLGAGPWDRPGLARGRLQPPTPIEPSYAGLRRELANAKAMFSVLDTDNDRKLSLEEFTAGAMYLFRPRSPRSGPMGPVAGPPQVGVGRRPQAAPADSKSDQPEGQTPRAERRRPRPEPPE